MKQIQDPGQGSTTTDLWLKKSPKSDPAGDLWLKQAALKSKTTLVVKRLDKYLLNRFLKCKKIHAKTKFLQALIENHARAEMYPDAKEPVRLSDNEFM